MRVTAGAFLVIVTSLLAINPIKSPVKASSHIASAAMTFPGAEEVVAFSAQLRHTPDENISFIKADDGQIQLWTQGSTPPEAWVCKSES